MADETISVASTVAMGDGLDAGAHELHRLQVPSPPQDAVQSDVP